MRSLTSAIALVAALATVVPSHPGWTQDVSPALAQRLRDAVAQAEPPPVPPDSGVTPGTFSSQELDHLVAPIALYPDALLAQVLVASTFPDQVSAAGDLIGRASGLSDAALSDAIAAGHWDPSVLALVSGFPSVVTRMADDMGWTRDLGAAVAGDDSGVMAAVQTMRSEAIAKGNLQSNRAQTVVQDTSGISIRPADPKVVYVPQYDPDTIYETRGAVYGGPAPVASSGVNPLVAGAIGFGAGLLVANLWHDDHHHDSGGGEGWPGYWQRPNVFDWEGGRFYPRPGPNPAPWAPPPHGQRGPGPGPAPGNAGVPPAPPHRHGGNPPAPPGSSHQAGSQPRQSDTHAPSAPPPQHRRTQSLEALGAEEAPRPDHRQPPQAEARHAQAPDQGREAPRQAGDQHGGSRQQASPEYCKRHPDDAACRR